MDTATLVLRVNLDQLPGAFHTVASAQEHIEHILKQQIPHYNPQVLAAVKD